MGFVSFCCKVFCVCYCNVFVFSFFRGCFFLQWFFFFVQVILCFCASSFCVFFPEVWCFCLIFFKGFLFVFGRGFVCFFRRDFVFFLQEIWCFFVWKVFSKFFLIYGVFSFRRFFFSHRVVSFFKCSFLKGRIFSRMFFESFLVKKQKIQKEGFRKKRSFLNQGFGCFFFYTGFFVL